MVKNKNDDKHINKKVNSNVSFSSINNDNNDNFQTANIIHKIKKIKQKKVKNNFKNIETFDTLNNTQNTETETETETKQNKPSRLQNFSFFSKIKQMITGKDITETFESHEYEGHDNIKEPKSKSGQFKKTIIAFIDGIYGKMNAANTYIAESVVNNISMNTATDKDVELFRNSLVLFESATVSIWMVYNWYFLMYYAKDNNIIIPNISRKELKTKSNDPTSAMPEAYSFILYLFEFAIWFPEQINNLLLNVFPKFTSWFLNGTCCFLIVYIICLYCTKNFAISFKNFFLDLLTNATSNGVINIMFGIVFILFFVSMFSFDITGDPIADKKTFLSASSHPIPKGIKWLLRFFITMVISVPAGAIASGLYLIIYSFFGRYLYGENTTTWKDIDIHIRNNNAGFQEEDMCNNGGAWSFILSILRFIFKITDYIKEHLLKVVYFVLCIHSTVSLSNNLSNMTNKDIIILFLVLITIAIGTIVYVSIQLFMDKDKSTNSNANIKPDITPSNNTENPMHSLPKQSIQDKFISEIIEQENAGSLPFINSK
jgi:hypothetical protein